MRLVSDGRFLYHLLTHNTPSDNMLDDCSGLSSNNITSDLQSGSSYFVKLRQLLDLIPVSGMFNADNGFTDYECLLHQ